MADSMMAVAPASAAVPDSRADVEQAIAVSVVVPVYNEEGCLAEEIDRIKAGFAKSTLPYEIIIVDDGSTDRTPEIAAALSGVRYIRHRSNRGSGTARKTGTIASRGEIVVWTDADLTYPNDEIPALVDSLGDADLVVGARTSEQGTMRILRTPAKWFIRHLAMYLAETNIPDLNSGFRAFRRSVALQYLHLLPKGFSCVSTLSLSFISNGHEVEYRPIEYKPRAGKSKFHPIRDAYAYLIQVIRMIFYFNPLRVVLPFTLVLALVGTIKLATDLYRYNFHVAPSTLLILLTAIQLFGLGLVADLIVRRAR